MGTRFKRGSEITYADLVHLGAGNENFFFNDGYVVVEIEGKKYAAADKPSSDLPLTEIALVEDNFFKLKDGIRNNRQNIFGKDAYLGVVHNDLIIALFDPATYVKHVNPGAKESLKEYLSKPDAPPNPNGGNGRPPELSEREKREASLTSLRAAWELSARDQKIVGLDNGQNGVIAVAAGDALVTTLRNTFRPQYKGMADPYVVVAPLDIDKALSMAFANASRAKGGGFGAVIGSNAAVAVIASPTIYNEIKNWPNFMDFSPHKQIA